MAAAPALLQQWDIVSACTSVIGQHALSKPGAERVKVCKSAGSQMCLCPWLLS